MRVSSHCAVWMGLKPSLGGALASWLETTASLETRGLVNSL